MIRDRYLDLYWVMSNGIKSVLYWMKPPAVKKVIKKNQELKDKYKGKRCFVVMGGPSLKECDTSKLSGEYVFGANNIYLSSQWNEMKPQFLCSIDPLIISQNQKGIVDFMKANPEMTFFASINDKEKLDKAGVDNVYYSAGRRVQHNDFQNIEFHTGRETLSSNILNYCIKRAMYMGFEEIYLLGCDFTLFNGKMTEHCYDEKTPEKKTEVGTQKSQAELYEEGAFVLRDLYSLDKYAKKNGVQIAIASPRSLIDVFPFVEYDALFK